MMIETSHVDTCALTLRNQIVSMKLSVAWPLAFAACRANAVTYSRSCFPRVCMRILAPPDIDMVFVRFPREIDLVCFASSLLPLFFVFVFSPLRSSLLSLPFYPAVFTSLRFSYPLLSTCPIFALLFSSILFSTQSTQAGGEVSLGRVADATSPKLSTKRATPAPRMAFTK